MSKEAAMSMLTGQPTTTVNPSLVAPTPTNDSSVATVGPETPTAPKTIDSDRFAKLAAHEAKIVKEREIIKAERAAMEAEKIKVRKIADEYEEFENLKKTDKIAAMKKAGFTEEDIFNFLAGKDETEPTPEQKAAAAAQAEIKKFQDEQAAKETKAQQERDDRAITAYRAEIGKTITKEAEKYEYCNYHGAIAQEIIYETILGFIKDDPKLTPHDAMKEAITWVEKMYEDEDKEMSKLKKRQPVTPPTQTPAVKPPFQRATAQKARTPAAPTITNKATATAASATPSGKETPSQKRERLENWLRTGTKS